MTLEGLEPLEGLRWLAPHVQETAGPKSVDNAGQLYRAEELCLVEI